VGWLSVSWSRPIETSIGPAMPHTTAAPRHPGRIQLPRDLDMPPSPASMPTADNDPDERRSTVRVLWLIKGLGPGGAEMLLVSMARFLRDHDVALSCAYVLPGKSQMVDDLASAGVQIISLGEGNRTGWSWILRLHRVLRRGHFDVVHVHSPSIAAISRVLIRLWRMPVKIVYTEHNHWNAYNPVTRLLNRITFASDDARIAVSSSVRGSLPMKHQATTQTVVHGIVLKDLDRPMRPRDAVRRELGVPERCRLIITVANFRRQKAYPDLLAAAKQLTERHDDILFVAAGQGPLEVDIKRLRKSLDLEDRFLLVGHRTDVHDLLAASDIFVLASVWEGYPIALMEAMATGLACVSTRVGGATDAITDGLNGLLLDAGDVDTLVAQIDRLLDDQALCNSLGAEARRTASQFDIARASRHVLALYEELSR
jgi:glycosyltransferase involved in cell wall biosynthesis